MSFMGLLPVVAAVGAVAVVGAAIYVSRQNQCHQISSYGRGERYATPERRWSPCVICGGDVSAHTGYTLSCDHNVHYTCIQDRKRALGQFFHENEACSICRPTQVLRRQNRLTYRSPQYEKCAHCQELITNDSYRKLEGENRSVHNRCWNQMRESGWACPDTYTIRGLEDSSTNRSAQHEKCAHCQQPITNELHTKLECQNHTVHNRCWNQMRESGLTDCTVCTGTQAPRQPSKSSKKRARQRKRLAQQQQAIANDLHKKSECQNWSVPNTSRNGVQECGLTASTRPASTQGLSQQNNSSTNRSAQHEKCAHCQQPITNDLCKKMKCQTHSVHNKCWKTMENSGLMTCSSCFEDSFMEL